MASASEPVPNPVRLLPPSTEATLRGTTHSLALGRSGPGAVALSAVATALDRSSAAAFAAGCLPGSGNEVGGADEMERGSRRAAPPRWSVSTDVGDVRRPPEPSRKIALTPGARA